MSYNNLIKYCQDYKLTEQAAIQLIEKHSKSNCNKNKFLRERFILYAKERINQKKEGTHNYWGSKSRAVRTVIALKEYKKALKQTGRTYKNSDFKMLFQLVTDPRQHRNLFNAFKFLGEDHII